jgi:hypothetical protein
MCPKEVFGVLPKKGVFGVVLSTGFLSLSVADINPKSLILEDGVGV